MDQRHHRKRQRFTVQIQVPSRSSIGCLTKAVSHAALKRASVSSWLMKHTCKRCAYLLGCHRDRGVGLGQLPSFTAGSIRHCDRRILNFDGAFCRRSGRIGRFQDRCQIVFQATASLGDTALHVDSTHDDVTKIRCIR